MDNNVIDIRINDYGTLEVVTIPVKLYKDSYKVVKLRVKAPKNDTAILKVYGSDRDDAGEQVWTTSAYTLPYKEDVVISNKEYTVYEDYIPEEFCQKNGELYLTFSQGLMDLEKWVSIITSGTLNLYVSGEGFNFSGIVIPEEDKLAYKINKTFENYEVLVEQLNSSGNNLSQIKADVQEAQQKSENALMKANEINEKVAELEENAQSDWQQEDENAYDFIKNKPVIDTELSLNSSNAVQNKVITKALNDIMGGGSAGSIVTIDTEQTISGKKNFIGGLEIYGDNVATEKDIVEIVWWEE